MTSTDTNSVELLPCPFCGTAAHVQDCHGHRSPPWSVRCDHCHAEQWPQGNRENAVMLWNQRIPVWQPIETAPKDGTEILGLKIHGDEARYYLLSWQKYGGGFEDSEGFGSESTHWMPLPEPPK